MKIKYSIVIPISIAVVLLLIGYSLIEKIPPQLLTVSAFNEICKRTNLYTKKYGQPPISIKDLPIRDGYANRIDDGWGRAIIYDYDPNAKTVSLLSSGKDKTLGDNDDIALTVELDPNNMISMEEVDNGLRKYFHK